MLIEFSVIFIVCTISGVLTGLLGIGGGLVIVPFFLSIFPILGIDSFSLQQIIAISATCVFTNSAATVFYRRKEKYLDRKFIIGLAAFIILGTVSGAYFASLAPEVLIYLIYIGVFSFSIYSMNSHIKFTNENPKLRFLLYPMFAIIGAISSSIGIGGAALFAAALLLFYDKDTKALLPTITLLVMIHACFAFLTKLALGEVVLFIIPIAVLSSLIGSKIGVILCKRASCRLIDNLLVAVLVFGILRIAFELCVKIGLLG